MVNENSLEISRPSFFFLLFVRWHWCSNKKKKLNPRDTNDDRNGCSIFFSMAGHFISKDGIGKKIEINTIFDMKSTKRKTIRTNQKKINNIGIMRMNIMVTSFFLCGSVSQRLSRNWWHSALWWLLKLISLFASLVTPNGGEERRHNGWLKWNLISLSYSFLLLCFWVCVFFLVLRFPNFIFMMYFL